MLIHVVTVGETLYGIAREYGVSARLLAINNDIVMPADLPVGQSVIITQPTSFYTVKAGETLFSIASSLGIPVNDLYADNLILRGSPQIEPGQTLITSVRRSPLGAFQIGGYSYPFIETEILNTALPLMQWLMPFTYGFDGEGNLIPLNDSRLLSRAETYGTLPVMHLSTLQVDGTFSSEAADTLLQNIPLQETLIANVQSLMIQKNYRGLDVDFEFIGARNAKPYAEFIRRCRTALSPLGYGVIVALAPKVRDDQPGELYEGHDYALLGQAADSVLLMTYEWGYTYGPPLAVSPVPNVRRVIEYALTRIPREKIFEGMSNYGYDFTLPYVQGVSRAISLSTKQAFRLASETGSTVLYDTVALAPYFYYTASDGSAHVVWFEDARSIAARLGLLAEYGLKGALYWNLDRENAQNLTTIRSLINPAEPSLFSPESVS